MGANARDPKNEENNRLGKRVKQLVLEKLASEIGRMDFLATA